MATELGSAFISVGLGTNTLAGDIKKAFGASGDAGESAGKEAGSRFGGAVGLAAAAVGALGIGSFFKSAIGGAADLEQSVGAIDSVFKGSAGQMHEWAQSAATDVGLSANEFNELGTLIGSQLKNGGTAMDELGPKTKELISTGADLASMFGGTTSEAVDALSSALKGERDPIERYGVSLNQAKIDAEAAALGFGKVNGQFEQNAQQAATLSLITKQTADATGNFGRETDTLAHKQQVLNAQLANGKARIGTELLPVVAALTGALSKALGPAINGTVAGIKTIVSAGQGLYDLFAKGDFTSALASAFKVEEDSAFVGVLFKVRDAAKEVAGGFRAMGAAFKAGDGDITSSGLPGFMEQIGNSARKVVDIGKILWGGFKMPADVAASFGSNLNPILALGQTFREVVDKVVMSGKILAAGFKMPLGVAAEFGDKLNPLLMVGVKVRETFSALGIALAGVWSAIGPQIAALVPQAFALFQALSPTSLVFQALLPVLPQIATALGSVLAAVLPLVLSLTSQLLPIITQLVAAVLPPLIAIFSDVVGAIAPLITQIAGLLIPIIQALMPVVVMVFGVVAEVIKAAMQIVQGVIQAVTGIISGDWDKTWTGIGNIFSGIWNTIVTVVSGAIRVVGSVIGAGMQLAFSAVTSILGGIGSFFINAFNSMISNTRDFASTFLGFFLSLPGSILGALSSLPSLLVGIGQNMIQGLINGARGMINQAVQAVRDVGGAMLDGIKGFLGIHSPSRVFKFQVGQMIGEGLIAGVDSTRSAVANSVNSLVSIPQVPAFGAGPFTAASAGTNAAVGAGVSIGTVNVRDENEMVRILQTKQRDAQAVYQ